MRGIPNFTKFEIPITEKMTDNDVRNIWTWLRLYHVDLSKIPNDHLKSNPGITPGGCELSYPFINDELQPLYAAMVNILNFKQAALFIPSTDSICICKNGDKFTILTMIMEKINDVILIVYEEHSD